jgi:hypothetical protein
MFSAYLKLERRQSVFKSGKKAGKESGTPRFMVIEQAGYFKPLESIKNAAGEIVMFYQCNDDCNPNSTAETRLQCADNVGSVNFSSIYLLDLKPGKILIGYGEPPSNEMLMPVKRTKKGKDVTLDHPNVFYGRRNDGYVFILTPEPETPEPKYLKPAPKTIEILVVPNGRDLIRGYAMKLADGQLDEALERIRNEAK